jgi:sugar phosphate isomerase/epimerase
MTATRRQFLQTALAVGSGMALASAPAAAIEPIARAGTSSHLRLSIAGYSFRKYLALDLKPKPPMTFDDFIDLAATMNLDAVELTQYYFQETTPEYLAHLKGRCSRLGLDVSGTAVGNNFCTSDPDKLRQQIALVKQWVEHSSRLGAKTIRIFAGGVDIGDTEEQARTRCVAAIEEACEHAGKYGIYLALENHGGIVSTAEGMLAIIKAVRSDWFGVNWDTGNFRTADPYADLVKIAPYAVTVQIKREIQPAGMSKQEADLHRMTEILRSAGYRGYVALEYESDEDPKTGVPKVIEALKKLMG